MVEAELIAEREQLLEVIAEQQKMLEERKVALERFLDRHDKAAEVAMNLKDVLSTLRIEVMAMESELEQYLDTIPPASRELICGSLKESASNAKLGRELVMKLGEIIK